MGLVPMGVGSATTCALVASPDKALADNSSANDRSDDELLLEDPSTSNTCVSLPDKRRVRMPVVVGTASDHASLRYFLGDIFGAACQAAFQASLDHPLYDPSSRLLLRRFGKIVAHAQITERVMQFGSLSLPVAGLNWLATAPDCRGVGLGRYLLSAAEKQMAQNGALIGLLRTRSPHFFRRSGWALCGHKALASAPALKLLTRLTDERCVLRRRCQFQIRPWRQWEEESIARIYRQNLPDSYGTFERSRSMWQWILARRAFDELYVALDGPDLADLHESTTRVVGYAAISGDRVTELMTSPGEERAATELLARVCADAFEQDRHQVEFQSAPNSPLLARVREAGQQRRRFLQPDGNIERIDGVSGGVVMARLLNPLAMLQAITPQIARRAFDAGLALPLELGFLVDGQPFQIKLGHSELGMQGACCSAEHIGRSYLKLNVADFTRLLIGQLDWQNAIAEGRVVPSTVLARQAALTLFPEHPFWRPSLDELASP
jgi:GNAT superfamily N-acetyltransferase